MLVLYGAGGHGRVALDCARATGAYGTIAFVDDNPNAVGTHFCGCQVLGGLDALTSLGRTRSLHFLVSIGSNSIRAQISSELISLGLIPQSIVHPSAVLSPSARVGLGSLIMPRVVVNANAVIGSNCILNTGSIVEHDCTVEDHVHLSPAVCLGGGVAVGTGAHLGIGAILLPGVRIGKGAVVGAGAVVLSDVTAGDTVVGVPAAPVVRKPFRF